MRAVHSTINTTNSNQHDSTQQPSIGLKEDRIALAVQAYKEGGISSLRTAA